MQAKNPDDCMPITEDDVFLERMLKDAHIPVLMMSIIHMTGDSSLLEGDIRPKKLTSALGGEGDLTEAERHRVRSLALDVLKKYRDRKCPPLEPLPPDIVRRMSSFVIGETVTDEYLPMMYQEMRLDARVDEPPSWFANITQERKDGFPVIIIGAGMMGMLCGIKLDKLGIPYTILEKNDDIGGTWLENTYPGLRVDLPNHFYSYSFERNPDWSHHFSVRDELLRYFQNVAAKYELKKKVQFGSEVEEAHWCESDSCWRLKVRRRNGTLDELEAKAVISAVGQLSRPKLPDIPGRDRFKGVSTHTSGYDRNTPIAGARVAIVGTAATALQMAPEVAKSAAILTLFQRTAHWVWPMPTYHYTVSAGKKWLLSHVPNYANWYRFYLFWGLTDGMRDWYKIDPTWPHQDRSVNAINENFRIRFTDFIKQQIGNRPELLAKVIPKYPPFADRILLDNGDYYRTLTRSHVNLVTSHITSIDETGINDANGQHHDVDIIVYATGFRPTEFLYPMRIVGKDGRTIDEYWQGEGRAYLGITVPNYPNFFIMWGPGTSGSTGGSMTFIAECQCRYTLSAIGQMIANGIESLECRQDVYDDYYARYRKEIETMVFSSPVSKSYFKNAAGKVVYNQTWRLVDYFNWTRSANLDDYEVAGTREPARKAERRQA
jgi:4-hydroxyacetophenone monooxygenase